MIKPAIVIPIFERIQSLKKLLWSIERAYIPYNVSLIFKSHDGAKAEVLDFAAKYEWKFGKKQLIHDSDKIDLDENLRRCGDLSQSFGSIIILEDDSIVSPYFYEYTSTALAHYKDSDIIAQISLYRYRHNRITGMPFHIMDDNYSNFLVQKTSTRGEAFTANQWQRFRKWMDTSKVLDHKTPSYICNYGKLNWEFQHNFYLIDQGLYSVWPKLSLSSNQGLAGTHHPNNIDSGYFQVPLQNQQLEYQFAPLNKILKYDAFMELHPAFFNDLIKAHGIQVDDVQIDLGGLKETFCNKQYWLTKKQCKQAIATFSDDLKPIELNVLWQLEGSKISLCSKDQLVKNDKTRLYEKARMYFSENADVGLFNYLQYKWLKYVERKKLNK